jgi:hypothetical protein
VHVGIVLLRITVISRETLLGMGNVKASISSTLQRAKDTASSGGGLASNIEKSAEWALVLIDLVNEVSGLTHLGLDYISINFSVTLVDIIKSNLLEETTSTEQSSAVGSSVVLQSNLKSITRQLVGRSTGQDAISVDEGVDNLANDLLVGETNDEAVLGRLVLVLGLAAKTLALTVVGAAFAAAAKLDLVAFVVRFGLLDFDERLSGEREGEREGESIQLVWFGTDVINS